MAFDSFKSFFSKPEKKESPLCALHIDDSRWVRIPVSVLLRRHFGMRVLEASSGQEGLELAEAAKPDVIILDIMMPQMDGFDTLAKLKANPVTKDIPVVMCTARSLAREVNMAVELGAMGFITKPIEEEALVDKIKDVLTAMGKWGNVVQAGRTNYQIPPDHQTDFVIPGPETEATPSVSEVPASSAAASSIASRVCRYCRSPLQFIATYNAW
jgi:CheY-like chemotaxis protein